MLESNNRTCEGKENLKAEMILYMYCIDVADQ